MPKNYGYGGGEGGSKGGGSKKSGGRGRFHDACYDQPGEAFPGDQPSATDDLDVRIPEDKSTGPMPGNYVPSEGNKTDKFEP